MMHAKIIEEMGPSRTEADETLAQCVAHLSPGDREYYHRRSIQETDAARKASCCEARLAHEAMAAAYRKLCLPNGSRADHHLASEMSAFLFNSRPTD